MHRTKALEPIWIKFCTVVYIPDVVTYANFGDHRLRGFWMAGGHISPSHIDFLRRPYNTLALPCERILTMMDYATRYPEAVPLKDIQAETVAEALVNMFTRAGVPKEI